MFNFIHNILAKFYFTSPSAHYVQPKSLNLRFKTPLDNKYVWLNLQNYNWVQPMIEQIKEEDNNYFMLLLDAEHNDGVKIKIDIAKFETRKEAESALNLLVNKLYSPEKSLIKFALFALIMIFILGIAIDTASVVGRNLFTRTQSSNQAMVQTVPSNNAQANMPAITAEDQAKIIAELQKQAGQPSPITQPPAPVVQENPAVKSLIDGLK